jgi:hypothetical protein
MHPQEDFKYFIQNEASDYQIISIIVDNYIPEEKYDSIAERQLWDKFQNIANENLNLKFYKNIVLEMGPIAEYNISSCRPVLNFISEIGDQPKFARTLFKNLSALKKSSKSALKKGTAAATKLAVDTANKGPLGKIAVGMSAGAAAALIAFAALKIYQNYLSKNARACKGKPDKTACMKNLKDKAMRMRIQKLRSGLGSCGKAKNPENCKKSLQSKITKLQSKLDKI